MSNQKNAGSEILGDLEDSVSLVDDRVVLIWSTGYIKDADNELMNLQIASLSFVLTTNTSTRLRNPLQSRQPRWRRGL